MKKPVPQRFGKAEKPSDEVWQVAATDAKQNDLSFVMADGESDDARTLVNADSNAQFNTDLLLDQKPSVGLAIKVRLERAKDFLTLEFTKESEVGTVANYTPVALAVGILAYFFSWQEPALLMLVASAVCFSVVTHKIQNGKIGYYLAIGFAIFFVGMSAAKLQVNRNIAPMPSSQFTANLTGLVTQVDRNRRGAPRYLMRVISIDGYGPQYLPANIRLSSSGKHEPYHQGQTINGLARLAPILGPAYPGGYDFAFHAAFKGQGLSGFFMGKPSLAPTQIAPKMLERFDIAINGWRSSIAARIKQTLTAQSGDIAVALITGDRSGLSDETQESLRRSGLAHILAISGLHMALVTLSVVWIARIGFSLLPRLSQRYPTKKWALCAGFVVATLYLFISGGSVATQRAWMMITVMLGAGLLDRRAITMRSVAIAATLILLAKPSSLFEPGFQMSFAAVAALVSFYRSWYFFKISMVSRQAGYKEPNWWRKLLSYLAGLSATSLIAGTATAIIAIAHFHRFAALGVFANLGAMPLVSIFVMPLALLAMVLMPYGFENLALVPMGYAIDNVVDVSDYVNQFSGDFYTGAKPKFFLIVGAGFLCLLCLSTSKVRFFAMFPLLALLYLGGQSEKVPDFIISQDGRTIAVSANAVRERIIASNRNDAGKIEDENAMIFAYPRRNKFVRDIWAKAYAKNKVIKDEYSIFDCGKDRCEFEVRGKKVSIIYDPSLLKEACNKADILIAPRLWWVNCYSKSWDKSSGKRRVPENIYKRSDFEQRGTHAFWLVDTLNAKIQSGAEGEKTIGSSGANAARTEMLIKTAWPENSYAEAQERRNDNSRRNAANSTKPDEQTARNKSPAFPLTSLAATSQDNRRPWLRRFPIPKPAYKKRKTEKPNEAKPINSSQALHPI